MLPTWNSGLLKWFLHWRSYLFLLCTISDVSLAQRNISIFPSTVNTTNTYSIGFPNLAVRAEFLTSDVTVTCLWKYQGRNTSSFIGVATGVTCNPANNTLEETVSCAINGTQVTSKLTILQPLSAGSLDVILECDGKPLLSLPSLTVQGCQPACPLYVVAECGTSCSYQVNTTLSCSSTYSGPPGTAVCEADGIFETDLCVTCVESKTVMLAGGVAGGLLVLPLFVAIYVMYREKKLCFRRPGNSVGSVFPPAAISG